MSDEQRDKIAGIRPQDSSELRAYKQCLHDLGWVPGIYWSEEEGLRGHDLPTYLHHLSLKHAAGAKPRELAETRLQGAREGLELATGTMCANCRRKEPKFNLPDGTVMHIDPEDTETYCNANEIYGLIDLSDAELLEKLNA